MLIRRLHRLFFSERDNAIYLLCDLNLKRGVAGAERNIVDIRQRAYESKGVLFR